MLPKEQIPEIKKQLSKQIENLPQEQKAELEKQINEMSDNELEEFLIKNKLISTEDQQCIFCQIANKKIPSVILAENEDAIAVLEINPVSEGHTIIIPKNHVETFSQQTTTLSKSISQILQKKLNPKKVEIIKSEMFKHATLNLIPVYDNENLESPRKKTTKEELEKLKEKILKPEEEKPKPKPKPEPTPKIKSRLP